MAYSAGTAFLTVVPSFADIQNGLDNIAEEIGRRVDRAMSDSIGDGMRDGVRRTRRISEDGGNEAGRRFGDSYSRAARQRITAAIRNLPDAHLNLDDTEVQERIKRVREKLAELRDAQVGIDLDDATFRARLRAIQAELAAIGENTTTVQLRADVDSAHAEIRRFLEGTLPEENRRGGQRSSGAFARAYQSGLADALHALPDIDPTVTPQVQLTPARARLAELRVQLQALSDEHLDVNVDSTRAVAQLRALQAQFAWLALNEPDVTVRVNATRAAAELAAILVLARRVDNTDVAVNVNADSASNAMRQLGNATDIPIHRLGALVALGFSLGPALIPMASAAAVAIGGIATAALGAVAGVGVLALGLSGILGAVQALNKYQQDTAKSAKSLSQADTSIANAVDSVKSAERGLANTRASVAEGQRRADKAVTDAERGVTEAVRDRRAAEEDLIQAIKEAQKADEDRRISIRGNALDIRQANLDIADAKKELDKVLANPRASQAEREQAQITYEQRVLQLDQLQIQQKRLAEDQAKFNKEGVNGTDQVKAAQERLRASTQKVADAQDRVAEAINSQREQQRQGSFQLAQATQALTQAQRGLQQATVNAGTAGGQALANLKTAMDRLSPAGQEFAKFIFGLKDQFLGLRHASEEALLPSLQRGIQGLLRYLPAVTNFISKMGRAVGDSFEWAVSRLQDPTWQKFFRFIDATAAPAWQGMVRFTEALTRAIAALIMDLSLFNGPLGRGAVKWAEDFARWAEKLSTSSGFRNFITYVRRAGPDTLHFLGQLFELLTRILIAGAPVGEFMLSLVTKLIEALNALPLGVLTVLLSIFSGLSSIMLLLKARAVLWRAFTSTLTNGGRTLRNMFNGLGTTLRFFRTNLSSVSNAQAAFTRMITRAAIAVAPFTSRVYALGVAMNAQRVRLFTAAHDAFIRTVTRGAIAISPLVTRIMAMPAALQSWARNLATAAHDAFIRTITRGAIAISPLTTRLIALSNATRTWARALPTAAHDAFVRSITRGAIAISPLTTRIIAFGTSLRNVVPYLRGLATDLRSSFVAPAISAVSTQFGRLGTVIRTTRTYLGGIVKDLRSSFVTPAVNTLTTQLGRLGTVLRGAQTYVRGVGTDLRSSFVTPVINTAATQLGRFGATLRSLGIGAATGLQGAYNVALARVGTVSTAAAAGIARFGAALRTLGVGAATSATSLFTTTLGRVGGAVTGAVTAAGRFATTLGSVVVGALSRARSAMSSLTGFLGGPWGVAFAVATVGITALISHSQKVRQEIKEMRDGLLNLVEIFRDGFTPSSKQAAQAMLVQDTKTRELVGTLQRLGIDTEKIVQAVGGERSARDDVVRTLDDQIRNELHLASVARNGSDAETTASDKHRARAEQLRKMRQALIDAGVTSEQAIKVAQAMAVQDDLTAEQQKALNDSFTDGARAADLLRNAYKQLYGDAKAREEAIDAEREAYDRLTQSVQEHGTTLDANTEAGRANREALRNRIETLGDLAQADIASTGAISKDTQDRIDKLHAELVQMGFNEQEVDRMIKLYLGVPPKILTEIILNGGGTAEGTLNAVGQKAVSLIATYGLSPQDALLIAKGGLPPGWRGPSPSQIARGQFAKGGGITGPGTKTSDSVPVWASTGEWIHQAAAVDYYGHGFMQAINERRIPREIIPGYATGGLVDWKRSGTGRNVADVTTMPAYPPFLARMDALLRQKAKELEALYGPIGGDAGIKAFIQNADALPYVWGAAGPGAYDCSGLTGAVYGLIRHLPGAGRGARYFVTQDFAGEPPAGFKPGVGGLYTIGVNPATHMAGEYAGLKFEAASTRSGIKVGANARDVRTFSKQFHLARGGPITVEMAAALADPRLARILGLNIGGDPSGITVNGDKMRVSYDSGGWLVPGWNPVFNGTGSPEAVLSPTESQALVAMARQGATATAGNVYQFEFRDTTLTPGKLRAMQDADAAYQRIGRPR